MNEIQTVVCSAFARITEISLSSTGRELTDGLPVLELHAAVLGRGLDSRRGVHPLVRREVRAVAMKRVISAWQVGSHHGRAYHYQIEDHGVADEHVIRTHWTDKCPNGTDCPLGGDDD